MNTKSVDFEYKYQIEAVTEVVDTTSGAVIYQPKDILVPETVKKVRKEHKEDKRIHRKSIKRR